MDLSMDGSGELEGGGERMQVGGDGGAGEERRWPGGSVRVAGEGPVREAAGGGWEGSSKCAKQSGAIGERRGAFQNNPNQNLHG